MERRGEEWRAGGEGRREERGKTETERLTDRQAHLSMSKGHWGAEIFDTG